MLSLLRMKICICLFCASIFALMLSSCASVDKSEPENTAVSLTEEAQAAINDIAEPEEQLKLFTITDDYRLEKLEPIDGCYLGAYVLSNKMIDNSLNEFENVTGTKHCIYKYYLQVGEEFPDEWVLSCIASQKLPYFVFRYNNPSSKEEQEKFSELASKLAMYSANFFIELRYEGKMINNEKYIEDYRSIRAMFHAFSPKAAFVWCVDQDTVAGCINYYPGDKWVDWVGINILVSADTLKNPENSISELKYFYFQFQHRKPIMLSSLGISHVSSEDYMYCTKEAADAIESIYKEIEEYPRIKAVIYMDFNGINIDDGKKIKQDYTISGEDELTKTYAESVSGRRFISGIEFRQTASQVKQRFLSPFPAYRLAGDYYIPVDVLKNDLGDTEQFSGAETLCIDGMNFIRAAALEEDIIESFQIDYVQKALDLKYKTRSNNEQK